MNTKTQSSHSGKKKRKTNSEENLKPKSDNFKQQSSTKKQIKSSIDIKLLTKKATLNSEKKNVVTRLFDELPLSEILKSNIENLGFKNTTEIQDKTFEQLLNGNNLLGIADTGTGKTGAFLIPIIERLLKKSDAKFKTLVVVPTRELALQVYDEFKKFGKSTKLTAACFIGGTNIEKDVRTLHNHFDFIIGTPGRLLDLKNRGNLNLSKVEVLILDEFDKMLDMGFVKDVKTIIAALHSRKQTLLFSATKDPKQQKIIDEIVKKPFVVEINKENKSSENVDQGIIRIKEGQDKFKELLKLLEDKSYDKVILFSESKHLANRLAKRLNSSGVSADAIHGDKAQNYRVKALDKFKNGEIRVLVATDVAARGIDINNVSLVVNFQLPRDYDTYIHRVGRTGRAGKSGQAFTFID